MNQITGKIVGVLIGLLTRRPLLIVIGLVLGHLYDIGVFSNKKTPVNNKPAEKNTSDSAADLFRIFDLPDTASMDDVENAYRKKISEYHPDKVANAAPEIQALAEKRAREIYAAYEAIQKIRNP
jgi:preprotein translocase subunit Sec63